MSTQETRPMQDFCKAAAKAGFDVYMRKPSDTYAYFTNGKNIGYAQLDRFHGISLSTVHIPNQTSGTGFSLGEPESLERAYLETAFQIAPDWAGGSSRQSVRKWPTLYAFLDANKWGGGLSKIID